MLDPHMANLEFWNWYTNEHTCPFLSNQARATGEPHTRTEKAVFAAWNARQQDTAADRDRRFVEAVREVFDNGGTSGGILKRVDDAHLDVYNTPCTTGTEGK